MDALTLLRDDHRSVARLFKQFEGAGDNAHAEKRRIVDRIIEELSMHASIEEQVFYPVTRAAVTGIEDIVLESLEEHHIVKWTLSELEGLDPTEERFVAKVTVLIESVRHHVKEEETEFFPKVRKAMSRAALKDLGEALASAKKSAPTHPHPRSPDTPPANAVANVIAGVVDRVGDNVSGVAQGSVTAVQDLIARIVGSSKPQTSSARKPAKKAAKSGAKATTTTAKKSIRATGTTAKRASTTTGRTAKKSGTKAPTTAKRSATRTKAAASKSR